MPKARTGCTGRSRRSACSNSTARRRTTSSGPVRVRTASRRFETRIPFVRRSPATRRCSGAFQRGLHAYHSADGIRWSRMASEPVITAGAFDSQNLAFWDPVRSEYRAYWRIFAEGVRAIRTATSQDFLHWDQQADLRYVDSPVEHLYTNAILPYTRAPHLFIGFPTRFQPQTEQVEPVFMSSRDGVLFRRWPAALIPITAPQDRDGNRSNYMTWGLLELPGRPNELSVYATEAYYAGPGSRVRRFTFRTDGFVSVHADSEGRTAHQAAGLRRRVAGSELLHPRRRQAES